MILGYICDYYFYQKFCYNYDVVGCEMIIYHFYIDFFFVSQKKKFLPDFFFFLVAFFAFFVHTPLNRFMRK